MLFCEYHEFNIASKPCEKCKELNDWIYVDNAEMKGRYKIKGDNYICEFTLFLKVSGEGQKTITLPLPESK